jgi:hypothetical protein
MPDFSWISPSFLGCACGNACNAGPAARTVGGGRAAGG